MAISSDRISIVIPAFNEEKSIERVVTGLRDFYPEAEILVVNDGSKDRTKEIAEQLPCRLITHRQNQGYGASWKTGIRNATREYITFFDGDGQFDPEDVRKLYEKVEQSGADLVSGNRVTGSHQPISRRPGKFVLLQFANFLSRRNIPDANCGLRAFRREMIAKYVDLLPNGFSASMTSLLLFFNRGYIVEFVPIVVTKREGKSSVRQIRDGFGTILLMLRLSALFDPLRIFIPTSLMLLAVSVVYSIVEALIVGLGVPVLGATMFIGGMLLFFLGIVCDQISALRLERFTAPLRRVTSGQDNADTEGDASGTQLSVVQNQ